MISETLWKIGWLIIFITGLVIVGHVIISFVIEIMESKNINRECLDNIAKQECLDRNLFFYRSNALDKSFKCKEDFRQDETILFRFTDEEMEGCKNQDGNI